MRTPAARDRVELQNGREVVDVDATEVVAVRRVGRRAPVAARSARRPRLPSTSSSLARPAIHPVASVSAGPPCGGLYLKPPSRGGLCDGVTTIPSASPEPARRPALWRRIACDSAGVGVYPSCGVDQHRDVVGGEHLEGWSPSAGSDRAWVSRPRNSGPSIAWVAR